MDNAENPVAKPESLKELVASGAVDAGITMVINLSGSPEQGTQMSVVLARDGEVLTNPNPAFMLSLVHDVEGSLLASMTELLRVQNEQLELLRNESAEPRIITASSIPPVDTIAELARLAQAQQGFR